MKAQLQHCNRPGKFLLLSLLFLLLTPGCQSNIYDSGQSPSPSSLADLSTFSPIQTPTPTVIKQVTHIPTRTNSAVMPPTPSYRSIGELGKGILPQIVCSPDGRIVLVNDGITLRVINSADNEEIGSMDFEIPEPYGIIFSFSPDSRFAIVSRSFLSFEVIEVSTQKSLGGGGSGTGGFNGAIFTPDSKHVVYLAADRTTGGSYHDICRLDFLTEKGEQDVMNDRRVNCFPVEYSANYHTMTPPAISPDGTLVAAGYRDSRHNILYIWDFQSKTIRFEIKEQPSEIESVSFSPDGSTLATGGDDGVIRLWNTRTGMIRRVISGFLDAVTEVQYTPDGRALQVKVVDQATMLYGLATGRVSPAGDPVEATTNDPIAMQMLNEGYMVAGGSSRLAFSPDGSTLAVAHGSIQVWDVTSRHLIQTIFTPNPMHISGMVFSPNAQHLAVITDTGDVLSWEIDTGKAELNLTAQGLAAGQMVFLAMGGGMELGIGGSGVDERGIAFSPDSTQLAIGNGTTVEIWDIASITKTRTLESLEPATFPTKLSYSPNGKQIYAVLNRNRDAAVWDADTGKLIRRLDLPHIDPNAFTAVALFKNEFARSNYDDSSYWIELWDLEQAKMVKLPMPGREMEPLRFSSNGHFLLVTLENRLYVWQVSTGRLVMVTENTFDVGDFTLSPDGKTLATAKYGKVILWDVGASTAAAMGGNFTPAAPPPTETPFISDYDYPTSTPQPTLSITLQPTSKISANAISISNASQVHQQAQFGMGQLSQMTWEGSHIYVTGAQGVIRYAAGSLQETGRAEIDEMVITSSRVLSNGRILVAGNTDNKVQLWEMTGPGLESKKKLLETSGSSPTAISPDGNWLVFYTNEGLQAKNVETGQDGIFLHDKWYDHLKLNFSPNGKLLAVSRSDRSVRIYDFITGKVTNGVGGPEDWISQMAFNKTCNLLVGAAGGSAWIWSVVPGFDPEIFQFYNGKQEGNLVLFDNTVTAVSLNPDSKLLAVATSENFIWLYDRLSKQVIGKLTGHFSAPIELAFSPDGDYLASVDRDGALIVWEIARQVVAGQVRPETGAVRGLVVRQDRNLMAWGEHTIWQLDQISAEVQNIAGLTGGSIIGVSGDTNMAATYLPYQVSLYNTETGAFIQTLPEEAAEPFVEYYWEGQIFRRFYNAVFSRDGSRLATVGSGGVWVYKLPDMKLQRHLEGNWSVKAAISREGGWLVASTFEKASPPELFNLETGETIYLYAKQPGYTDGGSFPQYAISEDMRYVGAVYNGWDQPSLLLLFDTASGQSVRELAIEKVYLTSLALNANTSLAAIGQEDGIIKLVDLARMKVVAELAGHQGAIITLAFSQDGQWLYSLGAEGVVKIWGLP